jgi:diacylglycerol kinase (ATP)
LTMFDIRRLIRAVRYSYTGLRDAFVDEPAFRLEILLSLILIPIAVWLGEDNVERALMIGTLMLVLIVELLNSAIESAVDRISTGLHDLSRKAKDLGSAAVFVSLALVIVVWALTLLN